jgi:acyl-CoA reductase-like NAD-dependent aldehyde dehydrogenase
MPGRGLHELTYFVTQVKATVRVGLPSETTTTMGSVISFQHLNKIESMIKIAVENEGGTIVLGGNRPTDDWAKDGAFLMPTIITGTIFLTFLCALNFVLVMAGLSQCCTTIQEEIFGPVVSVQRFSSEEEALSMANGVR